MDTKQTTFDRLCILRDWLRQENPKITEAAVERKLGLASNYFKTRMNAPIAKGGKGIREQTIVNVVEAWNGQEPDTPELNINWLASGNGDMFNRNYPEDEKCGIPYFNEDFAQAYWIENFQKMTPTSYVSTPPYNQSNSVCVNASGNAMSPTIQSGDMVVMRSIENVSGIVYGDVYALITKDGARTIRRIIRANEEGSIRVAVDNDDLQFGDYQDIKLSDIKMLFKVLSVIRTL